MDDPNQKVFFIIMGITNDNVQFHFVDILPLKD